MADKDYHAIVTDLIANAIRTSKVTGENGRITRLVAGSIGRFAAELKVGNQEDEAQALIEHAQELLAAGDGAEVVPALTAAVAALAVMR
ncbi:hypothetical protein [Pseudothauera rhizosphaerae]|uniref:Uncharacterized protein n=1 Tax=Pseudothauera rhizosphaerae TaxID=2565932 RepID=A0A4S4AX35_9RHOO|nr:hypothetical protein [Pseudothauera rhizosphaerae]THF64203.1 hypothetical protein E6O51_02445 [Pseudothauera rhizosphaerae]